MGIWSYDASDEPLDKTYISIICILASFILQESKDMQCKTEYYQLIQV